MESAPMPVMRGAAPKRKLRRKKERKADLQLARVVAGDKVGDVDDSDRVQKRKKWGLLSKTISTFKLLLTFFF